MKNYLKQFVTGLALLIVLSSCQQAALPQENQGNQPPQVKFQFEPNRGVALLEVNFDASSSSDDGSIVMYNWDFGDGSSATGVTTTHRFSSQGNYNVTLSIIDNEGLSASISQTILVQESAVPKPPEQPNPQENRRLVAEAYQLEIKLVPLFKQRLAESVSAAVIASLLANTGELVTTGTLTQLAPSVSMQQLSNAFRYDPNPNDHLRVVLLDGKEYELRYTDLQGTLDASLAQDGAAFVENDHKASVHIMSNEAAGSYNIQLDSLKFNGAIDVSIQGSFKDEAGLAWTTDLSVKGTYFFNGSDASLEENLAYRGTLSAPSEELNMTIDRDYKYYSIDVLIDSSDEIRHRWTYKGQTYQADNMRFRRLFKAGRINEVELWRAEGSIQSSSAQIGKVGYSTNQTTLSIYLELKGERMELYSFMF